MFDLEKPREWSCRVEGFMHEHSFMEIRLLHPIHKEKRYLWLEQIFYFEGPLFWEGAHFELASAEETLEFVRDKQILGEPTPEDDDWIEYVAARLKLLKITEPQPVRIVAVNIAQRLEKTHFLTTVLAREKAPPVAAEMQPTDAPSG